MTRNYRTNSNLFLHIIWKFNFANLTAGRAWVPCRLWMWTISNIFLIFTEKSRAQRRLKGSNKKRILPVSVCVCVSISVRKRPLTCFSTDWHLICPKLIFSSKLHSELKKVAFLSLSLPLPSLVRVCRKEAVSVCVCVQCVRSTLLLSTKNTVSAATLARGGSSRLFSTLPLFANGALQPWWCEKKRRYTQGRAHTRAYRNKKGKS